MKVSNIEAQVLETKSSELSYVSEEMSEAKLTSHAGGDNVDSLEVDPHVIDPHVITLLQGKYDIKRRIGSGAQGDIYEAQCLKTGKRVAIKQLRVDSAKNWKQYDLFARETKVLESLNVPGTARFYEAIQDLDSEYPMSVIVQEYIDGRSLQSYLNNSERFSFEQSCGILKNLVEVLQKLHTHEPPVIHRDIKPSNILLRFDNDKHAVIPEVFIIDFGAVANPQVQAGGSTVTGTYGYMAPEQLVGTPTPASDIYAFAMLAVYLFSGTPPDKIETKELRVLIEPHLEHLPYIVTVFLRNMLEITPGNRLTDYRLIANTFEQFSKQNFDVHFLDEHAVSQAQKYHLSHVKSLGQPGNITLWQALPENTPRNLPKEYRKKFKKMQTSHIHQLFVSDRRCVAEDEMPKEFIAFVCLLLGMFTYAGVALKSASVFIFCIMGFILFQVNLGKKYKRLHLKATKSVFENGRKTLATVKQIRLLPSESAALHISEPSGLIGAKTQRDFSALSRKLNAEVRPVWEVIYAFNPPDDNDPEPLYHRYYSTKPIDDVVVGDVLPILYFYDCVEDTVYSMPYPLPIDDALYQCPNLVLADKIFVEGSRF